MTFYNMEMDAGSQFGTVVLECCEIFARILMDFRRHYLMTQELEPKLLDLRSTAAGITASTKTLSITVHQSKEGN